MVGALLLSGVLTLLSGIQQQAHLLESEGDGFDFDDVSMSNSPAGLLASFQHTRAAFRKAWPHRDSSCMVAPREWGPPVRVVPARLNLGFDNFTEDVVSHPIFIYADVLVARNPTCARLTTVRGGMAGSGGEAVEGFNDDGMAASGHGKTASWRTDVDPSTQDDKLLSQALPHANDDGDRIVWATHFSVGAGPSGNIEQLARLSAAWGVGCLSVGLWLCDEVGWDMAVAMHASEPSLRDRVTFHAAIGWEGWKAPYPTVMRNVPLMPFAPWTPRPPGGGARPQPWVLIADVDAVPSVGEGTLRRWIAAAIGGRLAVPPSHVLSSAYEPGMPRVPMPGSSSGMWFVMHGENPAHAPRYTECDVWDGLPEAVQCDVRGGSPDAQGWVRRSNVVRRATNHSRCQRSLDQSRTVFALPSFDVIDPDMNPHHLCNELVKSFPPGTAPSRAHAWLKDRINANSVRFQAGKFPPSYEALIPWAAWGAVPHSAGVLAVHYSHMWEPYVILKAPLPGDRPGMPPLQPWAPMPWSAEPGDPSLIDSWQPFDEEYRCLWFDKQNMFADLAAAPASSPSARYTIQVLPHVFVLNSHSGDSTASARTASEFALKHAGFMRLSKSVEDRGLVCRDTCPCHDKNGAVPPWGLLQSVEPEWQHYKEPGYVY